jgi:hypothetical protein
MKQCNNIDKFDRYFLCEAAMHGAWNRRHVVAPCWNRQEKRNKRWTTPVDTNVNSQNSIFILIVWDRRYVLALDFDKTVKVIASHQWHTFIIELTSLYWLHNIHLYLYSFTIPPRRIKKNPQDLTCLHCGNNDIFNLPTGSIRFIDEYDIHCMFKNLPSGQGKPITLPFFQ